MIDKTPVTEIEEIITRPVIISLEKAGFKVLARDRKKLRVYTGEDSPIVYIIIRQVGYLAYCGRSVKVETSFFDIDHILQSVLFLIS